MKAVNRWEAIDELLGVLVDAGQVKPEHRPAICAAVKARENNASTGVGRGIGIPHAQTPLVQQVVAAFGRSTVGIDFEALDGQPVKLVILFLIPQGEFQKHLITMAGVARLLNDKAFRAELEQVPDASAILATIRRKCGATPVGP